MFLCVCVKANARSLEGGLGFLCEVSVKSEQRCIYNTKLRARVPGEKRFLSLEFYLHTRSFVRSFSPGQYVFMQLDCSVEFLNTFLTRK